MKKIMSLLLAVVIVLGLCACEDISGETSDNENTQTTTTSTTTSEPTNPDPEPSDPLPSTGPTAGEATKPGTGPVDGTGIHSKASYTAADDVLVKFKSEIVTSFGENQLTNVQLQIYYWSEVYGFLNNYYYYLSYLGFDYTKPLDTQTCFFDKTLTWQQYFLDSAIQIWQGNTAFAELAIENNFTMPQAYRDELDGLAETLQTQATQGGYDSVEAMVQDSFGAGVTLADYQEYMEAYYLGYAYYETLYLAIDPTREEIDAYFAANEATLAEQGIKKDGTYTIDVRHILVMIDNIVSEMGGGTQATDEHWAACQAAAQKIYDEYLAGARTEEHFGELANQYSDDQNGNVTNGGLYANVKQGDMVAEFNDWCFDESRKPGDTGIVKTQFGYHIMYFVGSQEAWVSQVRNVLIAEKANELVENATARHDLVIDYSLILLGTVDL